MTLLAMSRKGCSPRLRKVPERHSRLPGVALRMHLCPAELKRGRAHLPQPADVFVTHIKPGEVDAVMSEIAAQGSVHRIHALVSGQVMALAD